MQAIIIFLLVLTPLSLTFAAEPLSIVINEIAWMGRETSFNDEWIELYNNSSVALNLDGWKLLTEDETPQIYLEGEIPARGFFLLERTDDETLPSITADLIYKGSLHNEGEYLKLIDNKGKVIDEIDCGEGWFAGDNSTKQTMERKDTLVSGNDSSNWQTSQNAGGTPKAENQSPEIQPQDTHDIEESYEVEPRRIKIYPSNIFINEILPSPEGADAENEWIELSNENNFEVELSGWKIRDTVGAIKTYLMPERTKIKSNGFLLLPRSETKITLQNSGDGLEILNPAEEIVHQVDYPKTPLGQSFNRTSSGWQWSATLTPGETNIVASLESPIDSLIDKPSKELAEGKERTESERILAEIGGHSPKTLSPVITFLIALLVAASSGIIVLFIKKRIENEE